MCVWFVLEHTCGMEYFVLQLIFLFSFCRCLNFCMITLFLLLLVLCEMNAWWLLVRTNSFSGSGSGWYHSHSHSFLLHISLRSHTHYDCFKAYFEYATILFMELEWHQCQLDDDCTFVAWLFLVVLPLVIRSLLFILTVCVAIEVSLEKKRNKCSLEELLLCVIAQKRCVLNIYEHTLQHTHFTSSF